MKFIAFILAFLMLSLTVLPCSDEGTCTDSHSAQQQSNAPSQNEHDHHGHDHASDEGHDDEENETTGNCTPFCICNCCGVLYTVSRINNLPNNKIIIPSLMLGHYQDQYSAEVTDYIWEPPAAA